MNNDFEALPPDVAAALSVSAHELIAAAGFSAAKLAACALQAREMERGALVIAETDADPERAANAQKLAKAACALAEMLEAAVNLCRAVGGFQGEA